MTAWFTDRLLVTGAGLADADENCRKFLDKTIVDCFTKVQNNTAFSYLV